MGFVGSLVAFPVAALFYSLVVLWIPWWGLFMWPLAVAGIGFKYLRISFLEIFGHPLSNPFCVALSSLEMVGLHSD